MTLICASNLSRPAPGRRTDCRIGGATSAPGSNGDRQATPVDRFQTCTTRNPLFRPTSGGSCGASREQERAGRIPKHSFYTAHAMCILCGHEFGKEGPCLRFVRGSGCMCTQRDCHYDGEEQSADDANFVTKWRREPTHKTCLRFSDCRERCGPDKTNPGSQETNTGGGGGGARDDHR